MYLDSLADKHLLVIRRLYCETCHRVHHELPDKLVPYKRYCSSSIESVIGHETNILDVAADESTIHRWYDWFSGLLQYWINCLASIRLRLGIGTVEDWERLLPLSLQKLFLHVGSAAGWLARTVRPVVNAKLWVQTRSAWMSG